MEMLRNVIRFYIDGFREMTLGRTLWAIILIKLFVLFAVLKLFFFPDLLAGKSDDEQARHVLENLTTTNTLCFPTTYPPSTGRARSSP